MEDNYEFFGGNKGKTQRKALVWLCSAQLVILYYWWLNLLFLLKLQSDPQSV